MKRTGLAPLALMVSLSILTLSAGPSRGQILFKDNFEGVAIGSAPNNGAQPGDWVNQISPGGDVVMVTNVAPPEGSQDLRIFRDSGLVDPGIGATFASPVSSQELKLTLYAQTPSSININLAGAFFNAFSLTKNTSNFSTMGDSCCSADTVLDIFYRNTPSTSQHAFYWNSGTSAYTDTGLRWTIGQWDQIQLLILPGLGAAGGDAFVMSVSNLVSGIVQTTGRITFDGPTVANSVSPNPTITRAYFSDYASLQNFFLDDVLIAVPEPTSALLFGLGAIVCLRFRRSISR